MRKKLLKSSVLVLLTLTGAALSAKAADGGVYDVNFSLYNTNLICAVYGLPTADMTDVTIDVLDSSVDVDGAGKLNGFAHIQMTAAEGSSTVMAKVSGTMGMKGNSPVVNMTLKGLGFATSGTANSKASLNVKFSGTPVYVGETDVYNGQYEMDGKVNGSFQTGIQGAKGVKVQNADAYIPSYDVAGMTQIDSCILSLVAVGNKLTLGGCLDSGDGDMDFHYEWNGTGSANVKNGDFKITLTGTGPMTGSKIVLNGNAVDSTAPSLQTIGNDMTFTKLSASGKVMGQRVKANGEGDLVYRDLTGSGE